MIRESRKRLTKLFWLFAFLGLQTLAPQVRTLTGTWQGVLKTSDAPDGLRIVIKISTTAADQLRATMYFINAESSSLAPASAVAANGASVKMKFDQNDGSWEGRLSADGRTLDGTWTQFSKSTPLALARATTETAWAIPEPRPSRQMMEPRAVPGFEVATVKPSNPDAPGFPRAGMNPSGTITTQNSTLLYLIRFAYDLHPRQVIGAPAWLDADKFDITAKPDIAGSPNFQQMQRVLRKVMAARFGLVFQQEKRELSAYTIAVSKGGGKIRKDEAAGPSFGSDGNPQHGLLVRSATMGEFISFVLLPLMDLPVVDQTGLGETRYTFTLKFTPDAGLNAAADPDAPPDIFAAMEQQLGLHIQKTRTQVDVMVIDKVSTPSEN